jgi:uncharacterized Ntn-hydrolase superfamily protein
VTFSIVARCAETGMFGVAVASSSPAVAARCAYARAGIGAVVSQNVTDPRLGTRALDLMALGATAPEAVAVIARTAPHAAYRQVLAIDASGRTAIHSGRRTLGVHAEARRDDAAAAGNLLADGGVPAVMLDAFERARGPLGDRIVGAMQAALAAGGEEGPVHSAGMVLVREVPWPVADLRCDWTTDCPIAALAAAWEVYRPQLDAYVARALDPGSAPGYCVPGDP